MIFVYQFFFVPLRCIGHIPNAQGRKRPTTNRYKIMKTKEANTHYSVADIAGDMTVKEMRDAASVLDISIPSKARKAEMTEIFVCKMPNRVVPCMKRLARFELELLDALVQAGSGQGILLHGTLWYYVLPFSAIVQSQKDEEDGMELVTLSDELRPIIAESLPAILNDPARKRIDELVQYAYGLVNLYGILDFGDGMDMITYESGLVDLNKNEDWNLVWQLLRSGFMNRCSVSLKGGPVLLSPFVVEEESARESIGVQQDIKWYKPFSCAEIMAAGAMPCISLPGKHYMPLVQSIKHTFGMDDRRAYETVQTLWGMLQYDANPVRALLAVIPTENPSFEKLENVLDALTAFSNDSPRWRLKGYSPAEIFAQRT